MFNIWYKKFFNSKERFVGWNIVSYNYKMFYNIAIGILTYSICSLSMFNLLIRLDYEILSLRLCNPSKPYLILSLFIILIAVAFSIKSINKK